MISGSRADTSVSKCSSDDGHAFAVYLHGATLLNETKDPNMLKAIVTAQFLNPNKTNLKIKIKTFPKIYLLGKAFIFTHVEGQSVIAICIFAF